MTWRYDFGTENEPKEGYIKIGADALYHAEQGYGFGDTSKVAGIRRSGEPFVGDFCIPFDSVFLTDVPDGNYIVRICMGDELAPTVTTIRSNGERLMLRDVRTVAGQHTWQQFGVNVQGGQFRIRFEGIAPRINALEITPSSEQITLFLAGDSTVTDTELGGLPQSGWGQMLSYCFRHDVAIANHARGGRSSKSFISEGRLDVIAELIKEGDYLFIQFGHNDQKTDEERHTDPRTTYPEYLMKYVETARSKNAIPVLITSVHRRRFDERGRQLDTHGEYLDAVRELAAAEGVALIDLAEKSKALFEELGPEGTKSVFLFGAPGEWINYSNGVQDNTHFQERGSLRIAQLVAEGIRELNLLPLAIFLR
ncbi:rhamnogalacturonan acetylesterase [Paenibacillus agaridevorans]|uniref:rhamnogalacturonan acetylesterase n=1 Tax=Paenibacillus agaridevorans TaxID=171404 RepID=UPI001BE4399F|nr:rhamnogalacturonan acetylesterase [Paenibacillus agaridevorans]